MFKLPSTTTRLRKICLRKIAVSLFLVILSFTLRGQTIPTQGLQIWLMADNGIVFNGSQIFQWADQSGNGHMAVQGDNNAQPSLIPNGLNGLPVVDFDGGDFFFTSLIFHPSNNNESTVFLVCGGAQIQSLIRIQDGPFDQLVYPWSGGGGDNWKFSVRNGSWERVSAGLHKNTWNLGAASSGQSEIKTWRQGKLSGIGAGVGSIDSIPLYIGKWSTYGEYANGQAAEIIVYNRELSDLEVYAVQQYLAEKWHLPMTPSNLQSSINGSGGVDLVWEDNSVNETHFEIYRALDQWPYNVYQLIDSTGAGQNNFSDHSVTSATSYFYQVRAVNENTFSEYTDPIQVTSGIIASNEVDSEFDFQIKHDGESIFVHSSFHLGGRYEIINSLGQIVGNGDWRNQEQIFTSQLLPGPYHVRFYFNSKKEPIVKKIIQNHP